MTIDSCTVLSDANLDRQDEEQVPRWTRSRFQDSNVGKTLHKFRTVYE